MKLEPVAWGLTCDGVFQNDGTYGYAAAAERFAEVQNQRFGGACQWKHIPLYAIHDGYVVVPVDELLAALAALIRPDDPLESLGGSARDRAFNFGVETAINRCKDLIASKDGAANVAAYTPKTVVNGYLLEACPKCGCFGSESPCAVCKLRAASPKEQS